MNARHKALALAFATALTFAALAPAAGAAKGSAQSDTQRKPQGPAAGPVIKLPRGEGAAEARGRESGAKEEAAPRRWEYCVISGFSYHQRGLGLSSPQRPAAIIRYLPAGSEEVEGATEDEAVNNAFARLGEDGWELAGVRTDLKLDDGNGKSTTVYFFKRPGRRD